MVDISEFLLKIADRRIFYFSYFSRVNPPDFISLANRLATGLTWWSGDVNFPQKKQRPGDWRVSKNVAEFSLSYRVI